VGGGESKRTHERGPARLARGGQRTGGPQNFKKATIRATTSPTSRGSAGIRGSWRPRGKSDKWIKNKCERNRGKDFDSTGTENRNGRVAPGGGLPARVPYTITTPNPEAGNKKRRKIVMTNDIKGNAPPKGFGGVGHRTKGNIKAEMGGGATTEWGVGVKDRRPKKKTKKSDSHRWGDWKKNQAPATHAHPRTRVAFHTQTKSPRVKSVHWSTTALKKLGEQVDEYSQKKK